MSALLLSLVFSRDSTDLGTKIVLLAGFVIAVVVLVLALTRHRMSMPLAKLPVRLQDTTAQIRVSPCPASIWRRMALRDACSVALTREVTASSGASRGRGSATQLATQTPR